MRLRIISISVPLLLILILTLVVMPQAVLAHEQRDVSSYHFEVGFFVEPAIEGQMNGIDLRVTDATNQKPVTGLETTLQAEVTCVSSSSSQTFSIQPVDSDGDPGHYNNGFIPTMPGQYKFRFFGNINGMPVDQTFSSGPNTFSDVLEATSVEFPLKLASQRELDSVARAAQADVQQAQSTASTANVLSIIGIVMGAIGIGAGVGALIIVRKK